MIQISILGCGWLGFPLAKKLIENGYLLNGSTTSESKLEILQSNQIQPFLIELSENKISGKITEFLNASEILIIDIPPKLRSVTSENFVQKIKNLIPYIENSSVNKVLFISSTSVYGDTSSNIILTEESNLHPDTESGKQLIEVENLLRKNTNFQTTIIRFGGLMGGDRNPVKHLAGKTEIANQNKPINFIHQEDCIEIVCEILKQDCWNETFNAVSPFHPTRKEYYTKKALELNLALPSFDEKDNTTGKIISSEKIEKVLGYTFINPHLI